MAILRVPTVRRTYDLNPMGSATALVTMGQDNPFDRRVIAKVRDLRGLDMGDAEQTTNASTDAGTTSIAAAAATALPTANSAPSFWDSAISALKGVGATVLPRLATNLLKPVGDSGSIPGTNPIAVPQPAPPAAKPTNMYLIAGGVAVVGVLAYILLKKK